MIPRIGPMTRVTAATPTVRRKDTPINSWLGAR
jgi:hypothetical protein